MRISSKIVWKVLKIDQTYQHKYLFHPTHTKWNQKWNQERKKLIKYIAVVIFKLVRNDITQWYNRSSYLLYFLFVFPWVSYTNESEFMPYKNVWEQIPKILTTFLSAYKIFILAWNQPKLFFFLGNVVNIRSNVYV